MPKENLSEVNIPSAYDSFPDSFLLNSRDVCQIMGYATQSSATVNSRCGYIPAHAARQHFKCNNGVKRMMFRLGDFRKLKEYRDLGLTYKEGLEQDESPYATE
tara:strand:+ start:36 stop:344 length:309 start_codon:yes stop_codon:yes gene_type:complete